jgi:hypothetical protein
MISPGYEAIMLALEANRVIELRLMKIARGGVDAVHEVLLMVQEKVDAAAEAHGTLMSGGDAEAVLIGYRRRGRPQRATAVGAIDSLKTDSAKKRRSPNPRARPRMIGRENERQRQGKSRAHAAAEVRRQAQPGE